MFPFLGCSKPRSPSSALLRVPLLKINYRKKGTLILSSRLKDLEADVWSHDGMILLGEL